MRPAAALLLLSLALPFPGAAQSPAARAALLRWQDTLRREVDTAVVLSMYTRTSQSMQSPEQRALIPLRAGLMAIRFGEVTGHPDHYQDALERFEEVQQAHADWPWGWHGAGLANLGMAGSESDLTNGIRELLGRSVTDRAVDALVKSAAVDSQFVDGIRQVADRAIGFRNAAAGKIALLTLRSLANQPAGHQPALLLARARVEREFGTPLQAVAPLEEFLEKEPSSALGLLELARTRFMLGRLDGDEPWFDGLALASDSVLAAYRGDIAPLQADSILGEFDRGDARSRVRLMRRYWADQDPDRLPSTAERMRDHYLRMDYARRNYRLQQLAKPMGVDPVVLAMGSELDDRGVVYVKHGPPQERAAVSLIGVPPNETWAYHRPDGTELLFHFVILEGEIEYHHYPSLLDVLARSNQFRWFADHGGRPANGDTLPRTLQTYGAELSAQIAQQLMLSRWNVSPLYRRMLGEGKGKADSLQAVERDIGETSAAMAGSFALRYELPLAARVVVIAAGQERSGATVQVFYSVRTGGVAPVREPGIGYAYPVRIRVAIVDRSGNLVVGLDTSRVHRTATLPNPGEQLRGRFPVVVPPGEYTARVAIESGTQGFVTAKQALTVHPAQPSTIALSDLALGAKSVRTGWLPRVNDTAWVAPQRNFSAREPMQLYFEVSGLPQGASYRTSLAVYRVSGDTAVSARGEDVAAVGGSPTLAIGFTQEHPGGVAAVRREVALQRLRPGEYVLQVTVSTPGGASAVRRQAFVVIK